MSQNAPIIPRRALRNADLELPILGLGAASIGNLYTSISDETAYATVHKAINCGATFIDTAPHYGAGLSESRIGRVLPDLTEKPILSTKVGRRLVPTTQQHKEDHGFEDAGLFNPVFDYSAAGIQDSLTGSLDRLGVNRIDIALIHDIGRMTHGANHPATFQQATQQALPALRALKAQGTLSVIGIGVNEIEVCEELIGQFEIDVILLAGRYTLLETEAALGLLNRCDESGIGVVIGGPFNSGLLVAPDPKRAFYNYNKAPNWAIERVGRLRAVCDRHNVDLPSAALQFPLAHPAVLSVIPGAQTPLEMVQIKNWMTVTIPAEFWADLKTEGLIPEATPIWTK